MFVNQSGGWALLASVQATNSPYFYIDASATNSTKRFYRAVVENSGNTNHPIEITITHTTATEGEAAVFTVRLSAPNSQLVTVQYATADGSALSGLDYAEGSGMVTFTVGMTETNVAVATLRDVEEGEESFYVRLSQAEGAALDDWEGRGTIVDRGELPVITQQPQNQTVVQGTNVTFTLLAGGSNPNSRKDRFWGKANRAMADWIKQMGNCRGGRPSTGTAPECSVAIGGFPSIKSVLEFTLCRVFTDR